MSIFYRTPYQSDITLFIDDLKAKNPKIEEGQRFGRNLLWDKAVDREAWDEYRSAQVEQSAYVYQTIQKK